MTLTVWPLTCNRMPNREVYEMYGARAEIGEYGEFVRVIAVQNQW